jgi:hypothetical protein
MEISWGTGAAFNWTRVKFVKVPIITGTNTDEGTAFGPVGINTTEQFFAYLTVSENIDGLRQSSKYP